MSSDLLDAWQWLQDCGGSMALSNNPMSSQLIQGGLAKKGGYDPLGRRMLQAIPDTYPPGYKPPVTGISDQELVDFFHRLPKVSPHSDLPREMALEVLSRLAHFPKSSPVPYKGTRYNLVSWVPELIGFDGTDFQVRDRGGVILLCPEDWVRLSQIHAEAKYTTRDAYIMGGILGTIHNTAVVAHKSIAAKQAVVITHDFAFKSICEIATP